MMILGPYCSLVQGRVVFCLMLPLLADVAPLLCDDDSNDNNDNNDVAVDDDHATCGSSNLSIR